MTPHTNLVFFWQHAGLVVKAVMLLLLAASVVSWSLILQRMVQWRQLRRHNLAFQQRWLASDALTIFFKKYQNDASQLHGLAKQCHAGYTAWHTSRNCQQPALDCERAMRRAIALAETTILTPLKTGMGLLATFSSVSPYVGLFGTVWGMMTALIALGQAHQSTIALVAPGIAEALVATAMGLFVAIPATIAYNTFGQRLQQCHEASDALTNHMALQLSQTTTHDRSPAHA